MNIRIGNDIKVKFTITNLTDFDRTNVKQMKVYFVNTNFENTKRDCSVRKRFPKEPFPQFYTPSKYAVHGCGPWGYNTMPRKCDYANFCPGINDPHLWSYYNGFGIVPDKFVDCTCGMVSGKPADGSMDPIFLGPSRILEDTNNAEAYFPANEQIMCGPYKMMVVLVVYEQGWNRNNLHTYTIDYGTLFNIVDDESGMCGNIIVNGDTGKIEGSKVVRAYFEKSEYYVESNSLLQLGEPDSKGNPYILYLVLDNGSVIQYGQSIWQSYHIDFTTDSESVLATAEGSIKIFDESANQQVTLTARVPEFYAAAEKEIEVSCTLHIEAQSQKEYIGFSATTNASKLNFQAIDEVNRKLFISADELSGNIHLQNYNPGYYLWIATKTPIKDVNCNHFDVPLTDPQIINDGHYCYLCPNKLIATNFDLTIER